MENRATIAAAIVITFLLNFVVFEEAPKLGKHVCYFDLSPQSLKIYLVKEYGLDGSDWDPFSYLGRPPLINYPILPFLLSVGISKILGINDPFLTAVVSDEIFWLLPVVIWIVLEITNISTIESTMVVLTYLLFFPIYLFFQVGVVRVATTSSISFMVITAILWYSELKKSIKIPVCITTSTASIYSNFIYTLPTLTTMAILESRLFLLPLVTFSPVLIFTSEVGKLLFDNPPESASISLLTDPTIVTGVIIAISTPFVVYLMTTLMGIKKTKKAMIITITVILSAVTISFVSPRMFYIMLKSFKFATQLDMCRLVVSLCITVVVLAARALRKMSLSISLYLVSAAIVIIVMSQVVVKYQIFTGYYLSPLMKTYQNTRISEAKASVFSASSPICTTSERPTYILGGGFYQGCCEVCLRIISSVLFPINDSMICEPLMHPAQHILFDYGTIKKVLSILPVLKISYNATISYINGYSDICNHEFHQRPLIHLTDAIPVRKFSAVYVGSYTDYSFLWLNIVRNAPRGCLPMIPLVRPYNVAQGQSLSVEELPWTGDILILDPSALCYPDLPKLIKRAREVVVVYSCPSFDPTPASEVIKVASRFSRNVRTLGPVLLPLRSPILRELTEKACVKPSPVRGAVQRLYNDRYRVSGVKTRFVIVPWGWAPFWAVNGREGLTCPVGPYTLVKTDGKPVTLHYVGWERHQSKAYEASLLLLALSVAVSTLVAWGSRNRG